MAEVLSIEELRNRIDVIDEQLVRLLNVRVACAVEVGRLKHEAALPDLSAGTGSRGSQQGQTVGDGVGWTTHRRGRRADLRAGHRRSETGRARRQRSQERS